MGKCGTQISSINYFLNSGCWAFASKEEPICCNHYWCSVSSTLSIEHLPLQKTNTASRKNKVSPEVQHFVGVQTSFRGPPSAHTQNDLFILAWCCIHYSLKTQKTLNWWTQSFVHSSVQLLRKSWMRAALSSSCFQSTGSCWKTISSQLTSFTARMWWKLHTKKEEVL